MGRPPSFPKSTEHRGLLFGPVSTPTRISTLACLLLCLLLPGLALGAPAPKLTASETQFFETRIRPVLADNCYKCHSKGAEKIKGGLLLDTRDGALKGGNTGPAVVPRDLEKSLLITAVRYHDKDLQMPPSDKKLSDQVIADLE